VTTNVFLIRHAQTSWNQLRRIQGGNNDNVLDEEGERQCRSLAERLRKENIAAVYASPLSRAMATARCIADGRCDVIEEPAFREMNCGTMEGAAMTDIGARLQSLVKGGDEDELLFTRCGGESCEQVRDRAWAAIVDKADRHRDSSIAVVSHYFVIAAVLCGVVGLPATQLGRFRLGVTSISTVNFDSYGAFLTLYNDRCHLSV
jgi:broad specificity phosphatase PhoE